MSSKLRMVLAFYPIRGNGFSVYKGGDVIRFLEHYSKLKPERPFTVKGLVTLVAAAHNSPALKGQGIFECYIWRVKRGVHAKSYANILNNSNNQLRWPNINKIESARKPVKVNPKKNKWDIFVDHARRIRMEVPAPADRLRPRRPIVDIEFDDPPEPRDR